MTEQSAAGADPAPVQWGTPQGYPAAPPPGYGYPPAPYGYWQPGPPVAASNGMATAGGTVGIVGFVLAWIPFLGIPIGIICGILAIIFSSIGISRAGRMGGLGKGLAVTGLVLGILSVIWKLIPGLNLI